MIVGIDLNFNLTTFNIKINVKKVCLKWDLNSRIVDYYQSD